MLGWRDIYIQNQDLYSDCQAALEPIVRTSLDNAQAGAISQHLQPFHAISVYSLREPENYSFTYKAVLTAADGSLYDCHREATINASLESGFEAAVVVLHQNYKINSMETYDRCLLPDSWQGSWHERSGMFTPSAVLSKIANALELIS